MKKYKFKEIQEEANYDNWWNGDVVLSSSTLYFNDKEKPLTVDWADFSESDVDKIKEKQWEIFADGVNTRLKAVCTQFIKRYEASEMKLDYFTDERQECWNVMFGLIPNIDPVPLNQWKMALGNRYLMEVQYYIDRTIKNGIDDGLGFIHSPNCKYQDKSIPDSRIYARFVWEYFKWLESLIVKEEKADNTVQKAEAEITSLKKEPITEPIIEPKSPIDATEIKQNRIWFKVGLLFANGEMDELKSKHTKGKVTNSTAIANELGNKNFRPYISESIYGTNQNDKNIFASNDKTTFITTYCENNGITVVDSFRSRIKIKEI